jgi:hypothetical protein
MGHGHGPWGHGGGHGHLHDVDYDAFLANDRTLDDPEVFRVERGGRVRLRLINGATATNFWLDLGRARRPPDRRRRHAGRANHRRRFEFAIAQRLDIVLDCPRATGAWPVFAVREGERARTGFVLATQTGAVQVTWARPPTPRLRSASPSSDACGRHGR